MRNCTVQFLIYCIFMYKLIIIANRYIVPI